MTGRYPTPQKSLPFVVCAAAWRVTPPPGLRPNACGCLCHLADSSTNVHVRRNATHTKAIAGETFCRKTVFCSLRKCDQELETLACDCITQVCGLPRGMSKLKSCLRAASGSDKGCKFKCEDLHGPVFFSSLSMADCLVCRIIFLGAGSPQQASKACPIS